MNIPIPCELGNSIITQKGLKTLNGVTWFQWNDGMEYTYFYEEEKKWVTHYFEVQKSPMYDYRCVISDMLLKDGFLKDKGYPLKGRGYANGYKLINNELYVELILTDKYFAHIYVRCNKCGEYVADGRVFVPPSWDTEQKQKSILLAQYNDICILCY